VPFVNGFSIEKVWDEHRQSAEVTSKVFYDKPIVCDSFAAVSDDVDLVFIADCNGDGSDHLKLARPGLGKGVPTFVDKPFAHRLADVRTLQRLAAKQSVPVMSLSIARSGAKAKPEPTPILPPPFHSSIALMHAILVTISGC